MFERIRQHYQQQTTTPQQRYDQALAKVNSRASIFIRPPQPAQIAKYEPSKRLSGIMVSIKDTFDCQGEKTQAGSCLPMTAADHNAACIESLLTDGAVLFGRTNMSEFAFSGLGINPHYGTPVNRFDTSRITGGSTSGGAISVAAGLCDATLGTDTGGSLRIPAAFNGLVGFKPCRDSVSTAGCFPLSPSLDCIGPITHNVADSVDIWRSLTGDKQTLPQGKKANLISPQNIVFDHCDAQMKIGFKEALARLHQQTYAVEEKPLPVLEQVFAINSNGGLVLPESAWVHKQLLEQYADLYDPLIAARIRSGGQTPLTTYIERLQQRATLQSAYEQTLGSEKVLICPTVAILPPKLKDVTHSPQAFAHYNKLVLRNTALFNYLDVPSISIPFYPSESPLPIGIMLCGQRGQEAELLAVALTIEQALARYHRNYYQNIATNRWV